MNSSDRIGIGVVLCGFLPVGCARPAGAIFAPIDPALVWPLPPDQPRIQYIGAIHSSADLHAAKSGWQVLREKLNRTEARRLVLTTPHAIAVGSDDRIYVADTGSASLHIWDLVARTHRIVNSADGQRLRSPVGVAVGPSSVFVTDAMLAAVFEYNLEGDYLQRLGIDLTRPAGIAYCPVNGRLYVVDSGAHRCVALAHDGGSGSGWSQVLSFGGRGTDPGKFNFPTYITYNPLLGLVISDTLNFRVQRFDLDGTPMAVIGKKGNGAGDFSLPKGVAVDSDGHLYVVDAQFENVQIFRKDGQLLLAFGGEGDGPGSFSIPSGLAIDSRNRIWIADSYNRRLQVFQYLSQP